MARRLDAGWPICMLQVLGAQRRQPPGYRPGRGLMRNYCRRIMQPRVPR